METAAASPLSCRQESAARQFAVPDLDGQMRAVALGREADPASGAGGGQGGRIRGRTVPIGLIWRAGAQMTDGDHTHAAFTFRTCWNTVKRDFGQIRAPPTSRVAR
jgi:hypothetical protein